MPPAVANVVGDFPHDLKRQIPPETRRYDVVRAGAFFPIGHLPGEDCFQAAFRHARPFQDSPALDAARRRNHGDGVAQPVAVGFKQKRDIKDDRRTAVTGDPGNEPSVGVANPGMDDGLKPNQRVLVFEHDPGQRSPVNAAVMHDAEGLADGGNRFRIPFEQAMDPGVGIVNGKAEAAEAVRRRSLSHSDRSRESENKHRIQDPRACRTYRRNSSVTTGSLPNQWAKPGRA